MFFTIFVSFGALAVHGRGSVVAVALDEGNGHVVVIHGEVRECCQAEDEPQSDERGYWGVAFEVVYVLDLGEAFGDKAAAMRDDAKGAGLVAFVPEGPAAAHDFGAFRER